MHVTDAQRKLAVNLLALHEGLGGPRYTGEDVERLAEGIARRSWLDRQLSEMFQTERSNPNPNRKDDHEHHD